MEQVKKLPVDIDTWKQLRYDSNYYVPESPFEMVAQSTIRFYENRLEQLDKILTEKNKEILRRTIQNIKKLMSK